MKVITMKSVDNNLWIRKGSLLKLLMSFLWNSELKDFETDDISEAHGFNWFTYGFFEYIFNSYQVRTRNAFIEYVERKN